MAASPVPQAVRVFENLSALQPQPTLFTAGGWLLFGNLLLTSLGSRHGTCGRVPAACGWASLPALPHVTPGASVGGKAAGDDGGKGS